MAIFIIISQVPCYGFVDLKYRNTAVRLATSISLVFPDAVEVYHIIFVSKWVCVNIFYSILLKWSPNASSLCVSMDQN